MRADDVQRKRAQNLWDPLPRKFPQLAKATRFEAEPGVDMDEIGGLAEPKEEILTYACAATDPEVYQRWGTAPPSALLLIGPPESGKSLLAEALATRTRTPFLKVLVPRLVLQMLHSAGSAGDLLQGWVEALADMPRFTVFFREVDFTRVETLVGRRPDVPVAPILDFVLELIDRTIDLESALVLGSTSHPDTVSPIFLEPGRFERAVSVHPVFPDDVVAALRLHAARAESRAGRTLFQDVAWADAVKRSEGLTIGDWVRLLHAVLRRKARCDAAHEDPTGVNTEDLIREVERSKKTAARLPTRTGAYL